MPKIHITTTDGSTLEFDISPSPSRIGRAEDNDFVVPDGSVSSHHGEIYAQGDAIEIVDHGSTNGTFVGGQRVERGTVNQGEEFRLGSVIVRVLTPAVAASPQESEEPEEHEESSQPSWTTPTGGGALGASPCPTKSRIGFGPKAKPKDSIGSLIMTVAVLSLAVCAAAIFMIMRMGSA